MKKAWLLICFALAACGGKQQITTTVPYDAQKAAYINKRGKADITGQAFLMRRDGMVVTCAGQDVDLFPAVEYATQRMVGIYGSNERGYRSAITANWNRADDEQYYKMNRSSKCDAEGDFSFKNVADGDYYVVAPVLWQISDYYNEGGYLMQKVSISRGKSQRVLLSK